MSFVLKTLGAGVLFVLLAIGAAVADIALNNGRIFFGMMGQEELTAACQPMLARAVAEKGVNPDTLVLGDVLSMNVSTREGKLMERQISAAHEGSRYAGSFTCEGRRACPRERLGELINELGASGVTSAPSETQTASLTIGGRGTCHLRSCERRLWEAHG